LPLEKRSSSRAVARLVPIEGTPSARTLGAYQDQVVVQSNFDAELPLDVLDGFEGIDPAGILISPPGAAEAGNPTSAGPISLDPISPD